MTDPIDPQPGSSRDPLTPGASEGLLQPSKEARTWGLAAHLAAFAGLTGIPFANILGPLIVWLIKKDQMPFVDDQGKESINFQITVMIPLVVLGILSLIPLVFCLTIPLMMLIGIAALIFTIIAAIKANEGVAYRYPFCLRLIK